MATLPLDSAYRPVPAEEFVEMDFGDARAELEDGQIRMMAGGTVRHAAIQLNLAGFFRAALRGGGCRPYGSDMAVRTGPWSVRYPDLSIHCRPVDPSQDKGRFLGDPSVIVEILSPGTAVKDETVKLTEYRALAGVDTILLVDPDRERVRVVQRIGPDAWRDERFADPQDVAFPSLGVVLPHDEIFARD